MDRRRLVIDKFDCLLYPRSGAMHKRIGGFAYCDTEKTPFKSLGAHALALDVPFQRDYSFRSDINVSFCLHKSW